LSKKLKDSKDDTPASNELRDMHKNSTIEGIFMN
jgi:hypothetical protein